MASGAFVAITANTSGYNNVRVTGMHGISFGYNQQVYLTVASHYYTYDDGGSTYISDASLTVEPGLNSSKSADLPMLISYPNLQRFKINGSPGSNNLCIGTMIAAAPEYELGISYGEWARIGFPLFVITTVYVTSSPTATPQSPPGSVPPPASAGPRNILSAFIVSPTDAGPWRILTTWPISSTIPVNMILPLCFCRFRLREKEKSCQEPLNLLFPDLPLPFPAPAKGEILSGTLKSSLS